MAQNEKDTERIEVPQLKIGNDIIIEYFKLHDVVRFSNEESWLAKPAKGQLYEVTSLGFSQFLVNLPKAQDIARNKAPHLIDSDNNEPLFEVDLEVPPGQQSRGRMQIQVTSYNESNYIWLKRRFLMKKKDGVSEWNYNK